MGHLMIERSLNVRNPLALPILKAFGAVWGCQTGEFSNRKSGVGIAHCLDLLCRHLIGGRVSRKTFSESLRPFSLPGKTIEEYFEEVATQTFLFDFYHSFQEFRDDYFNKHHKTPYINDFIQWRWDLGKSITRTQRDEAFRKVGVYRQWMLEEILRQDLREAFVILPIAAAPNYRNTQPGPPFKQNAFDALFLAPILGAPEFVVPIGQVPYESHISGLVEQLPVAVSVLGLPDTDNCLMDVVRHCLDETGRPTAVQTGRNMFPSEENN
ncbi:hypothetical protein DL98DRAFT_657750 [Cadophora sp. DSE1049]|nr:hypothetical protein DL98DRAFT_657750 [Cadophora sp. DSE1049]